MTLRRLLVAIALAGSVPATATAAYHETTNFVVEAPTGELARKFGEMAEYYRKEKALEWLGREMPSWPERCHVRVHVAMGSAGGATTFSFATRNGRPSVASQQMEIRGEVKQLLNSVLPHEVTHTVLAHHFGRPVPRWADEGGSALSENEEERFQHDIRCREILNAGRAFVLRTLFRMTEYPRDMTVLYAQGYSITAFLVDRGGGGREGRGRLLQFLATGMNSNSLESWNEASRRLYGFDSVDGMEAAWLDSLRTPPSRTAARELGNSNGSRTPTYLSTATGGNRAELRTSAAPAIPILEPPVRAARGVAPDFEATRGSIERAVGATPTRRPAIPERPPPVLLPPEIPRLARP
jgi:hypothetical protein